MLLPDLIGVDTLDKTLEKGTKTILTRVALSERVLLYICLKYCDTLIPHHTGPKF